MKKFCLFTFATMSHFSIFALQDMTCEYYPYTLSVHDKSATLTIKKNDKVVQSDMLNCWQLTEKASGYRLYAACHSNNVEDIGYAANFFCDTLMGTHIGCMITLYEDSFKGGQFLVRFPCVN